MSEVLKLGGTMRTIDISPSAEEVAPMRLEVKRYILRSSQKNRFKIPTFREILCVKQLGDNIGLWVKCDTSMPCRDVTFDVFCDGEEMSQEPTFVYVGTVLMDSIAWHVFHNLNESEPNS